MQKTRSDPLLGNISSIKEVPSVQRHHSTFANGPERRSSVRRKQFQAKKETIFTEIEELDDGTCVAAERKSQGAGSMESLDRELLGNQNTDFPDPAWLPNRNGLRPPALKPITKNQSVTTLAVVNIGAGNPSSKLSNMPDRSQSISNLRLGGRGPPSIAA